MTHYCGCCGMALARPGSDWCGPCANHVADDGPPWDRTFFAIHGEPCPYESADIQSVEGEGHS